MENYKVEVNSEMSINVSKSSSNSEKWLFVCHGFGGNKKRQKEYHKLSKKGINIVTISFRGNGNSDGQFIDQNLSSRIEDLEKTIGHFDPEDYYLFGTSFGGKVVFHSSENLEPQGVIAKAPVTYNTIMDKFRNVVSNKGKFEYIDGKPIDQKFFDDLDKYGFEKVEKNIDAPVLIFHGANDTTVHPKHSFNAAKKLDTSTTIHKIKDEKHSFSEDAKKFVLDEIENFVVSN